MANIKGGLSLAWDTTKSLAQLAWIFKGEIGKALLKKLITKAFQKSINVGKATIGFSEGGRIGNFTFHILNRETINFESEITDNYIDTNVAICDHIAKRPITITLQGQVGRYYHDISKDTSKSQLFYRLVHPVNAFMPKLPLVQQARKVKSAISRFTGSDGIVNRIANSISSYAFGWLRDELSNIAGDYYGFYEKSSKIEDVQTDAFLYLEGLWSMSLPISVVTTWKTYDNMIIQSLKPVRDENADITEFTVVLKQINTLASIVVNTSEKVCGGNTANQKAQQQDNGTTTGTYVQVPQGSLDFNDPSIPKVIPAIRGK